MNEGWLELESDPGLFTLLLEDFGVQGVQVEEIYDLQATFDGPVYGFIFLFKWMEERRSRRKLTQGEDNYVMDEDIISNIFFAKQIINNSCATHALLSVLLNCSKINLGATLTQLKAFTKDMNAEDKGFAIGNMPDLARAHNSHARQEPHRLPEKQQGISVRTGEAFHFVSYVPVNGQLFELDGLQPYPVNHGPWKPHEDWTEKFRRVIKERLGMATNGGGEFSHDIRFNLMAVVPDKRLIYEQKLKTLKTNRQIILETLQQMVKVTSPDITFDDHPFKLSNGAAVELALKQEGDLLLSQHKSAMDFIDSDLLPVVRTSARLRAKGSAYSNAFSVGGTSNGGMMCNNGDSESVTSMDSDVFHKMPVNVVKEETDSDIEIMDDVSDDADVDDAGHGGPSAIEKKQLQTVQNSDVKFHISISDEKEGSVINPTTLATTDVTKPLSIQTKFGNLPPGPGTGSSTDTASEIGSCFSSPVCSTGQPSPNVNSNKSSPAGPGVEGQVKVRQEGSSPLVNSLNRSGEGRHMGLEESVRDICIEPKREVKSESALGDLMHAMAGGGGGDNVSPESSAKKRKRKFGSHHGFTPKDLLQLLKNVENEVATCENNLKEEREKFKKYKIDDGRRTHNYDRFICTFLSMLAEQGHLADLVEQQTGKKKSLSTNKRVMKAKAKKRR